MFWIFKNSSAISYSYSAYISFLTNLNDSMNKVNFHYSCDELHFDEYRYQEFISDYSTKNRIHAI